MSKDNLHILHYTRFHCKERWGGREQVVDQYCRGLRKLSIESTIFATSAFSKAGKDVVHETPVERFDYFYPFFPLSEERKSRMDTKGGNPISPTMMKALKNNPPDLVHLHNGARLGAQVLRFCQSQKIPVVYSLHGGHFVVPEAEKADITSGATGLLDWGKVIGWWTKTRQLEADVDRLLCVGKNELIAAEKRGMTNVEYLPNGVDEERFASGDGSRFRKKFSFSDKKLLLVCGRIDTQKNQVGLIADIGEKLKQNPDWQIICVGSTTNEEYKAKLENEIEKQGVQEQVSLLGNFDPSGTDLIDAYAACDLFVLPSRAEPFGIVILEAWAASKPVVASNVDGIPFFVEHEKTGLLADPKEKGSLTSAIERALGDEELSNSLAKAGRQAVEEQFTWSAITGRLAKLYKELIEQKKVS